MKKNNEGLYGTVSLLLHRFFAVFALILLALSATGALLNGDNVLFCTQILWIALFAAMIAVTFLITDFFAKKGMGTVLNRAIHFVLSYLSFLAAFVFGGGAESYFKSNTALTNRIFMIVCMSFLFIGVYAASGVVRLAFLSLVRRKKQKTDDYQSLYSDLDTSGKN